MLDWNLWDLRHAYYVGRLPACLLRGGPEAIRCHIRSTTTKPFYICKVWTDDIPPAELRPPTFILKDEGHLFAFCNRTLEVATKLLGLEDCPLVAQEEGPDPLVAACVAGFLLRNHPYESILELNTLPAVLLQGILQKQAELREPRLRAVAELKVYARDLLFHETVIASLKSKDDSETVRDDVIFLDTSSAGKNKNTLSSMKLKLLGKIFRNFSRFFFHSVK
ncbi:uncharacterized protein LMH87_007575 [Akanthomyces muscarius]|uniref:Uncharacterized protein n=1 Tax=Akanthomyces muscarius TaxID=2231603 RepID=A0A9W8QL58_AKAMU|nr:uncharacterized protein LMH87_007575 [Akanthomyces muscarius]KAJ4161541.1 hypothetical protein LMH87_007575 [Akanthomyces muscarius]